MASLHGNGYSHVPSHFFKVILERTIQDGKLGIPRKFARYYGNTLSSPVIFEVPNGEVWELELEKLDGKMWVQNGWRKFAEYYSLELGHFLVFRYQGNCRFHVLIFDKSASEIHYPYTNDKENQKIHQKEVKIEESEKDVSLEIIDNISKAMRKKSVLQCPRPRNMIKAGRHTNGFSSGKGKVKRPKSDKNSKASSTFGSESPFFLVLMQPAYVGYNSDSNFCYLSIPTEFSRKYLIGHGEVVICGSNGKTWSAGYRSSLGMDKRSYVRFIIGWGDFVRDNNLQVGDVCVFELINSIVITFRVFIYCSKKADVHGLRTFIDVSLGHSKVHESDLQRIMKARDKALQRVLLANDNDMVIEKSEDDDSVQIINSISKVVREKPILKCPRPQKMMRSGRPILKSVNHVKKSKALERASSAFKSENPFFFILMQPTSVGRLNSNPNFCYLGIPKEFSSKYLMDRGAATLCDYDGKTWSAEYRSVLGINKRPYVRLFKGWDAFVHDNSLRVGDVCAFELTNCNDITFRVFIYRSKKADFHGSQTSTDVCLGPLKVHEATLEVMSAGRHDNGFSAEKGKVKTLKPYEKRKALERASSAFKSENPFFLVLMQPTYVGHLNYNVKCFLKIPIDFSRKYLMDHGDVVLCDSNGNTWSVEYHTCLRMNKRPYGSYVKLCNGWDAFVRDNELQVGDVCAFELINRINISFRVFIYGGEKTYFHGCREPVKVHETSPWRTVKVIADEDCHPSQGISVQPFVSTSQSAKATLIFRRVVLPLHLKEQCVDIPFRFVEQHFKPTTEKLLLRVADRSWPVKIEINQQLRLAKLTSGWNDFAKENSLNKGDICVYELDTVDNSLLKVSISKSAS